MSKESGTNQEGNSREVLKEFDNLKKALEAIETKNPTVAKEVTATYRRIMQVVLNRVTNINNEHDPIMRLSDQRANELCDTLKSINLPEQD